jgi:hypothetical protein
MEPLATEWETAKSEMAKADEAGGEELGRSRIEFERRAHLLDGSLVQNDDLDRAARRVLQPRDRAQERGRAASGRTDGERDFAIRDSEVEAGSDLRLAEALGDGLQVDRWRAAILVSRIRSGFVLRAVAGTFSP